MGATLRLIYSIHFLKRLRNGDLVNEDFELVRTNCCEHFMGVDKFDRRGFNNSNNITYVNNRNDACNKKTYSEFKI